MTLTIDNRDMAEMEKYYLGRIETLEKRVKELEAEYSIVENEKEYYHGLCARLLKESN